MTFLPPFLEGTQITDTTYKWDFPVKERQLLRVSTEPTLGDPTAWRSGERQHHHQQPATASPSSAVTHSRSQSDAVTTPLSAVSERPGPGITATETSAGPATSLQKCETESLHALVADRKKQSA